MLNKIILLFLISLFVSTFHISKVSADYKETEMDKKKLFKVNYLFERNFYQSQK